MPIYDILGTHYPVIDDGDQTSLFFKIRKDIRKLAGEWNPFKHPQIPS